MEQTVAERASLGGGLQACNSAVARDQASGGQSRSGLSNICEKNTVEGRKTTYTVVTIFMTTA